MKKRFFKYLLFGAFFLVLAALAFVLINRELRTYTMFRIAPATARDACLIRLGRSDAADVYLLGTIHGDHLTTPAYSLCHIDAVIRNLCPDRLLLEMRPEFLELGSYGDGPAEMPFAALTARELDVDVRGIDWWVPSGSSRTTDDTRDDHMAGLLLSRLPEDGVALVLVGYSHLAEIETRLAEKGYSRRELPVKRKKELFSLTRCEPLFPPGMQLAIRQRIHQAQQRIARTSDPAWKAKLERLVRDRETLLARIKTEGERPDPAMGSPLPIDPGRCESIASHLRLPTSQHARRAAFSRMVAAAWAMVDDFAAQYGWQDRMRLFFDHGVEFFSTQAQLWARILQLHGIDKPRPVPTDGLAAGLEKGVLTAVLPEVYARIRPAYGRKQRAFVRLLAHEMAHRLHVSILDGDEEAMGPSWFFEGFAIIASDDLRSEPISIDEAFEAIQAKGEGSYRKYAAALRAFMNKVPLQDMVRKAGQPGFENWLRQATR